MEWNRDKMPMMNKEQSGIRTKINAYNKHYNTCAAIYLILLSWGVTKSFC